MVRSELWRQLAATVDRRDGHSDRHGRLHCNSLIGTAKPRGPPGGQRITGENIGGQHSHKEDLQLIISFFWFLAPGFFSSDSLAPGWPPGFCCTKSQVIIETAVKVAVEEVAASQPFAFCLVGCQVVFLLDYEHSEGTVAFSDFLGFLAGGSIVFSHPWPRQCEVQELRPNVSFWPAHYPVETPRS